MEQLFYRMIQSGDWGRYHAGYTDTLEQQLAEFTGQSIVRLTASGTIAVELALRGVGIGEGDEVLLAGYDFPGNFRCIEACGARPVLIDVNPTTACIDHEQLEEGLTDRTRAILVSHLHSGIAPMPEICDVAAKHGLSVIEDACQSPGGMVSGKPAGSWGDVAVLSFGGSKLLTAGRGGAVMSRKADVMQRIRVFADRGNDSFPLSQLQAAIVSLQLGGYEEQKLKRQENVALLFRELRCIDGVAIVGEPPRVSNSPSYYKVLFRLSSTIDRAAWTARMQSQGIVIDSGFRGFARRTRNRCRKVRSSHAQPADCRTWCRAAPPGPIGRSTDDFMPG